MLAQYIVSAKRTAFGTFGGALKKYSATQLSAISIKGALAAGKVDPAVVDHVIIGNGRVQAEFHLFSCVGVWGLRVGVQFGSRRAAPTVLPHVTCVTAKSVMCPGRPLPPPLSAPLAPCSCTHIY
jgi:hypothetical protein